MHNLTEIKNNLIKTGFQELKGRGVRIQWSPTLNGKDTLMEANISADLPNEKTTYIAANRILKNAKKMAVIGASAHELAHVVIALQSTYLQRLFEVHVIYGKHFGESEYTFPEIIENFFRSYKAHDEKIADELVIQRGFGNALHEYKQFLSNLAIKENRPRPIKNRALGITKTEVLKLMRQFKVSQ